MAEGIITAEVFRFNPEKDDNPNYVVYKVQSDKGISVLNLLSYIQLNLDRSLAYRNYFCHLGVCMSCLLHINGKNLRGCTKIIKPGDKIKIDPPKGYKVIRDLVVDFSTKKKS